MEKVEKGQNQDLNSCPLGISTDALPSELHVLIETIITHIYYISKSNIPLEKKEKGALISNGRMRRRRVSFFFLGHWFLYLRISIRRKVRRLLPKWSSGHENTT